MALALVREIYTEPKDNVVFFNEIVQKKEELRILLEKVDELKIEIKELEKTYNAMPKYRKDGALKETVNNKKNRRFVHPIREREDIERIKSYLDERIAIASTKSKFQYKKCMQERLLFICGINIGIRVSDLKKMKWSDFYKDKGLTTFVEYGNNIKELKTGKLREFFLNDSIRKECERYLNVFRNEVHYDDYIFSNNDGVPFSDDKIANLMKECTRGLGIQGNFNTHSYRKTFAYQLFMTLKDLEDPELPPLETVQRFLNHAHQKDTLKYLGITMEAVANAIEVMNL